MNPIKSMKRQIVRIRRKSAAKLNQKIALDVLIDFLNLNGTSGKTLSEATYFACIKVLSESIGKLPIRLLQDKKKGGTEKLTTNPLYRLVNKRPNPYMTATQFWGTIEQNRNHYGNGYALIVGAEEDMSLWILPSNKVEIWYDDKEIISKVPDIYYIYSHGGKKYPFKSEEIIHVKASNCIDGITGIPVAEQLTSTIQGNIKAQKMLEKLYENGLVGKAVLNYTGSLSKENEEKFAKGFEKFTSGSMDVDTAKRIIPIPAGHELKPLNMSLTDSQFLGLKQYSALQIASAFGIKPYQIGDYTKSSYASAEAQQLSFYVDTLLYIIKQYEEELTYKLLSEEQYSAGMHFKFNVGVLLRTDLKTQIDTIVAAINGFLYTPNEGREFLDLEAVEGGDQLIGNGAAIPINMVGSQYQDKEESKKGEVQECLIKMLAEIISKEVMKNLQKNSSA